MHRVNMSRRGLFRAALAALGAYGVSRPACARTAPMEIKLPENIPGAPVGKRVFVQRATKNQFNVIVTPAGPFTDIDVSVKFYPLSGKEDASGGIVLRFNDGKYYVVRANALEGNLRLYSYDRGRRQLASASVKAPALGQWHTVRVVAVGDQIQAWLDGKLYLDHRDPRFKSGRVGLWTKADSVTAFDDLTIRGVTGGGG